MKGSLPWIVVLLSTLLLWTWSGSEGGWAAEHSSIRAAWEMPPRCQPFGPVRIDDLREELRQTGYRLVIAIHPERPGDSESKQPTRQQPTSQPAPQPPARDLYLVNADGSDLKQLTETPDREEHVPRTAPDGKWFTYNYGDYLVDAKTFRAKPHYGGYVWTPDGKRTAYCGKNGIVYTDIGTGKSSEPVRLERRVSIVDVTCDGRWFIFELRNYLGNRYTIDFLSTDGGPIRKMPNHPAGLGECHPAFSPDGKWMCWNAGGSLAIRKFDPSLPDGTDGEIVTLPKEDIGQDPCGRWSHCGRYIAYVKIPHGGSWRVHSPICVVRVADSATLTISPPGWVGHHWDYDWLPPEDG